MLALIFSIPKTLISDYKLCRSILRMSIIDSLLFIISN